MFNLLAAGTQVPLLVLIVLCLAAVVVLFACAVLLYVGISYKKRANASAEKQKEAKKVIPLTPTDEIFLKHKRRFFISAIIKSAICGVSLGLLVVGIILLSLKLNAISIHAVYYVLIGVGIALVCGGLVFLILRPTDQRVAKKLDEEHQLNERVQTSLAYRGQTGLMIELQRGDAGDKMQKLSRQRLSFAKVWQYCVIGVLALSISFTAFFIPAKQVVGKEPDDIPPIDQTPYIITPYQEAALNELMVNINESHLTDSLKRSTVFVLAELLETLRETDMTIGEMHGHIYAAIDKVHEIILPVNLYADVAAGFAAEENILSQAIMDGIATYKYNNSLVDYDNVRFFYTNRISTVSSGASPYIEEIREQFRIEKSDELYGLFGELSSSILSSLEASGVDEKNALYAVLDKFAADLPEFAEQLSDYGHDEDEQIRLQEDIDNLFRIFFDDFIDELAEQAYNLAMDTFVENRVLIIFDLYVAPDTGSTPPTGNDPNDGGDIFDTPGLKPGSYDKIFNPLTGEYVLYSELLQEYYNLLDQITRGGNLTAEQEHAARVYFNLLFNGFDD